MDRVEQTHAFVRRADFIEFRTYEVTSYRYRVLRFRITGYTTNKAVLVVMYNAGKRTIGHSSDDKAIFSGTGIITT